jgi:hypothetical protein
MASTSGNGITEVAFKAGNVLPSESPTSLSGDTAKYASVGGKKRMKKTAKRMSKKMEGGSALAFSELAGEPRPTMAPPITKQAGGKKRRTARRTKRRGMSIKGLFKLFKKK